MIRTALLLSLLLALAFFFETALTRNEETTPLIELDVADKHYLVFPDILHLPDGQFIRFIGLNEKEKPYVLIVTSDKVYPAEVMLNKTRGTGNLYGLIRLPPELDATAITALRINGHQYAWSHHD